MFERIYGYISDYVMSSKIGKDVGYKSSGWEIIAVILNFIWWTTFLVSCFLFTYNLFNWSFLNFDCKRVFLFTSIAGASSFLLLIICMLFDRKSSGLVTNWVKTIISLLIGTTVSVSFTFVLSYMLKLDKSLTLSNILVSVQIPYFIVHCVDSFLLTKKTRMFFTNQISSREMMASDMKSDKIDTVILVLIEIAMIAFVVYFGAVPFFRNGGLEAIREKADAIIKVDKNLLFGSGGIVGIVISALGLVVKFIGLFMHRKK